MQNTASPGIFTLQFWLLGTSSFLFSSSFNMLIPELPGYLSDMGGAEYKGFIIGLFTLTAGISRPFSGRLTDRVGRVPVMAFGSLVCFVCGFLYPIFTKVMPFLLLRLVHGFSTGFKPTGTAAYIADIIPANRRGEAMGIHGMCMGVGSAFGPAIGSMISQAFSMNALFYTSSFFALLSIVILFNMKETLVEKEKLSVNAFKLTWRDIFEPDVFSPAFVTFLAYFGFGAVATLTPDFSEILGLGNKGMYFMVFTLFSILIRFVAGKLSDRKGRIPVTIAGCLVLILSMVITGYAETVFMFLTGAAFFGVSMGILSPVLSAWTVDLSSDHNRGRAIATMYICLEAGIGLGAFLSAALFANKVENLPLVFLWMAGFAVAALLYSIIIYRYKKRSSRVI
ncbi:Predicted arabinose efflux permease, MFS family [Dyadobacter koreensis]|uniref:Predicted arabinose efflux permease, MFS family n=1 Tax=Dyadobacter koreensis TaxID=408657 RepID=A0A1H6WZ50_9BACT|nr:MFS transporter [Dyadobacter koreensis]SEJ21156.1 Predicted arabinose efflux permease, MFS family [Dyadobacter koreensis]